MEMIHVPAAARALARFTPKEVLLVDGSETLQRLRDAVQGELSTFQNVWVQLEIEAVRCLSFNFDGLVPETRNEVYVVGWMVDGAGQKSCRATQIKPGVRKGDLVNFTSNGAGAPIARIHNPVDCVYWGFAVMEDDAAARELAALIEQSLESTAFTKAIGQIATAAGAPSVVSTAVESAAAVLGSVLLTLLKNNRDDLMLTHEGGGLAQQGFRAHDPGEAENETSNFARARYAVHLYRD